MRNLTGYSFEEVVLTKELMEQFLEEMNSKGFGRTSLETYRNRLNLLYKLLPEDKCIRKGTVEAWQQVLWGQMSAPGCLLPAEFCALSV